MDSIISKGSAVIFVDPVGVEHQALVTNCFGPNGEVDWSDESQRGYCVNVVWVSDDEKETDSYGRQIKRQRIKPRRPPVWEISADTPGHSARLAKFAGRREDFAVREICKPAIVVHVQVRKDHLFHVARSDAERTQLRTDFFLALDLERDLPPQKWMIRFTGFEQMRALTGVYDKYALSMFDCPGIRWKPFGPIAVGVKSQPPSKPVAAAAHHSLFDSDGSGLDCMDAHRRTSRGWRHG